MFSWSGHSALPIGVDISLRAVRLLQLRRTDRGLALLAAASCPIDPAPEAVAPAPSAAEAPAGSAPAAPPPVPAAAHVTAALRTCLKSARFVGTRCVTALTAAQAPAKSVRLPPMPEADLLQAAQWEARDRLGLNPADGRLVCLRAGEIRRGTGVSEEVLLFAAAGAALRTHIDPLMAAGLRLDAIDLAPLALYRAASRTGVAPAQVTALADLGTDGSQLLICHQQRLMFYKSFDIGSARLDEALARKLSISPTEAAAIRADLSRQAAASPAPETPSTHHLRQAVLDALRPGLEELTRELDMCLRYFVVSFRATRPEQLLLSGSLAHDALVQECLANTLSLPVQALQPLAGMSGASTQFRPDRGAEWALAAGLALYQNETAQEGAAA
jgi:type IV pilus assembly protein PilM